MSDNHVEPTAQFILSQWMIKYSYATEGHSLYKAESREEYLEVLALWMFKNNIPYDDASGYNIEKSVGRHLTTEEGRKSKEPKKKDWYPKVISDFKNCMAKRYMKIDTSGNPSEFASKKPDNGRYIPENKEIKDWVDRKYHGNPFICTEAHRIFSFYFIEFMDDVFGTYS